MRLFASLMIAAASLGIGLRLCAGQSRELRELRQLARGIRLIRAELSCRVSPMRELVRFAGANTEGEICRFFERVGERMEDLDSMSFSELWRVETARGLTSLSADERMRWTELGATLGRYGLEDQLLACDRYLAQSEQTIAALSEGLPDRRRITLAVSVAAGVFLCLLLV